MKILVTGSDGFIGKHVVRIAKQRGHKVEELDKISRTDMSNLPMYWFNDYDCVIHLAAYIDIKESISNPWKYVENNLVLLKKLKQAKRVVFASSAAVYGDFSPYGYAKRLGEALLPKNSISLRMFNPFGPGENHEPETHIIPLLAKSTPENPVRLYQGGNQVRDFIYVEDAALGFVMAAESNKIGAYDLCAKPLSIREVARLMNAHIRLEQDKRDSGDTSRLVGNSTPFKMDTGWGTQWDVNERLINWRSWYNDK